MELRKSLKEAESFIESLKGQLNNPMDKRKELVEQLKGKEGSNNDTQALKEKSDKCEQLAEDK